MNRRNFLKKFGVGTVIESTNPTVLLSDIQKRQDLIRLSNELAKLLSACIKVGIMQP